MSAIERPASNRVRERKRSEIEMKNVNDAIIIVWHAAILYGNEKLSK